jgi:hypothetical protein
MKYISCEGMLEGECEGRADSNWVEERGSCGKGRDSADPVKPMGRRSAGRRTHRGQPLASLVETTGRGAWGLTSPYATGAS